MNHVIFLTGFPGFIGRRLLEKQLNRPDVVRCYCLIQKKFHETSKSVLAEMALRSGVHDQKVELLIGDISMEKLGLDDEKYHEISNRVTMIYHAAAIYDLAVKEEIAWKINVTGTKHVIAFAHDCPNLFRLNYISTCYVSGKRRGTVRESELEHDTGFKNHYESTKYAAEMLIREAALRRSLPVVVFRPSIVVGDSRTGQTDKYDGPYFFILLLLSLPNFLPIPYIGKGRAQVNLVPVDYAANVIDYISYLHDVDGLTFQIADPTPYTAKEQLALMSQVMGKKMIPITIPLFIIKWLLSIPVLNHIVKVPAQLMDYLDHRAEYDTSNMKKYLSGTDIACPNLKDYLGAVIEFAREHPDRTTKSAKF